MRRREPLSDHLVRLVLADLDGFASTGIADEWVGLVVPGQFQSRYYTVRSFRDGELTLDVVVHEAEPWDAVAEVAAGRTDVAIVHRWEGMRFHVPPSLRGETVLTDVADLLVHLQMLGGHR